MTITKDPEKKFSFWKFFFKYLPCCMLGFLIGLLNLSFFEMVVVSIVFALALAGRDLVLLDEHGVDL